MKFQHSSGYTALLKDVCCKVGTNRLNPLCEVRLDIKTQTYCKDAPVGSATVSEGMLLASGICVGDTVDVIRVPNADGSVTVTQKTAVEVTPFENKLQLIYHGWPSCCAVDNGDGTQTVYAVGSGNRYRHVDPFGETWLYRGLVDVNGDVTWSDRIIVNKNKNYRDLRDAGIISLGNGKLVLTYFINATGLYLDVRDKSYVAWQNEQYLTPAQLEHIKATWDALDPAERGPGAFVQYSNDDGQSWSEPMRVPVSAPHGLSALQNGELLYVGRCCAPEMITKDGIYACRGTVSYSESGDINGIDWKVLAEIPYPSGYEPSTVIRLCEPHAIELQDGTLLAVSRTHGTGDENLSVPFSYTMCSSTSSDGGKSWTLHQPLGFTGAPPHLLQLDDGAVILSYARRDKDRDRMNGTYGEYARISLDGGKSWGEEICLGEVDAPNGDLGYPSTACLSKKDGAYELITVYYGKFGGINSFKYTTWCLKSEK